jgi:hypothetical protein
LCQNIQIQTLDPGAFVNPISAVASLTPPASDPQGARASISINGDSIIVQACRENIAGFERAYKVTFYAAFLAVFLGMLLPGWPGKWIGRK